MKHLRGQPHPSEKRKAAQTCCIRSVLRLADSSSEPSLRDRNDIVEIHCARGFHSVLDIQNDLGGDVANR